jgi:hypothetical protein
MSPAGIVPPVERPRFHRVTPLGTEIEEQPRSLLPMPRETLVAWNENAFVQDGVALRIQSLSNEIRKECVL